MERHHIVLTDHPEQRELLQASIPATLNDVLGQVASYVHGDWNTRRFTLLRSARPGFLAWAKRHHAFVEDRSAPDRPRDDADRPRPRPKPVQCGNVVGWVDGAGHDTTPDADGAIPLTCDAPYPASRVPDYCGACGQPARPVVFEDVEPITGVRCESCSRVVQGGAKFCPRCGAVMPPLHHGARPVVRDQARLEDPMPLGDVMAEWAQGRTDD